MLIRRIATVFITAAWLVVGQTCSAATEAEILRDLLADGEINRAEIAAKLPAGDLKTKVNAALPEIAVAAERHGRVLQLAKDVAAVGGKMETAPGGPEWLRKAAGDAAMAIFDVPVSVDLYDGNNPLKGKGGLNKTVNDDWLAKLAGFTSITSLNLANCDVHGAGLKYVATLKHLENLGLTLTPTTDADLEPLGVLTELTSLQLASTKCTGTGFQYLRGLKRLSNLNMHFTPADDAGLAAVAQVGDLERLWVVHAKFTDAVAPSLAAHKNLKRLGIGSSLVESSGKALAEIGKLPLHELELFDKQATDEAIGYAAAIPTLRLLNVSYAPTVTDAAIDSILKMSTLEELKLGPTKITDAGLAKLAGLKSLKKLSLGKSKTITDAAIAQLRTARPDLTIDAK